MHGHTLIQIILDAKINGRGFLSLNVSLLQPFGLTLGFVLPLMNIIEDLVCSWTVIVW